MDALLADIIELRAWALERSKNYNSSPKVRLLYRLFFARLNYLILKHTTPTEERIRQVLAKIETEIKAHETKHQMTSAEFAAKWASGELPEREEYFDWNNALSGRANIYKHYGQYLEDSRRDK